MAAVGRPASGGPIVVVRVDDRIAGWCDGVFTGNREMIAAAHRAVQCGSTASVNYWEPEVTADATTALGAAAALITFNPGRAVVEQGPEDVMAAVAGADPLQGMVF